MQLPWPEATVPPNLSHDEAHVWAISIDEQGGESETLLALLSDDERRRAEQFRIEAPRRRFITARAALRRLLGEYRGIPAADVPLAYDSGGKPRLAAASGRDPLRFNLAHTEGLAVVGLTRGCDIGVDVERIRVIHHLESIARRYFHPRELAHLLATPNDSRHEQFMRCWTAKEAVLKAVGTGLGDFLAAFCIAGEGHGAWIDLPALGSVGAARCWVQQLTPCAEAIAAVAFVGQLRRVQCLALANWR